MTVPSAATPPSKKEEKALQEHFEQSTHRVRCLSYQCTAGLLLRFHRVTKMKKANNQHFNKSLKIEGTGNLVIV